MLLDGVHNPCCIINSNSRLAISYCSGESRLALDDTGCPFVSMTCCMLCFLLRVVVDGFVISGKRDIILERPDDAYTKIKQRLIDHFSISEEKRIKSLLNEMPIGDKKPSSLLREMRSLANGGVKDEFLRTMWLQRLPSQTQAILATSSEALDNLALMADKIGEISNPSTSNIAAIQNASEVSELRNQISALTTAVNNLKFSRGRSQSRSNSRNRQRSSSQQVCYYHRKFGTNARCCRQPCNYNETQSGNSQGGH